jgi:hypothetical protein
MKKCWLIQLSYATEGGAVRKKMTSRPMTYSQAFEMQAYWQRRGVTARLIELNAASREHLVTTTLRRKKA